MSPVNKMMMLGVLILAGMLVLGGCGSSTANSETPFNSTAGYLLGRLPAGHAQPAQVSSRILVSNVMGAICREAFQRYLVLPAI